MIILLTRRKSTKALIRRASNHANLLPEMPRYCCPIEIIKHMTEIKNCLPRTSSKKNAVKCLSQGHNRGFEPIPC